MKKLIFGASICIAMSFYACNGSSDNTNRTDSLDATAPTATAPADSMGLNRADTNARANWTDKDRKFAEEASRGGQLEVALGNLAKERATTQSIKDFGQTMVTDHTQANNELATLLKNKNITVDVAYDKDQQKLIDKLSNLGGKDFEKEYVDAMVKDHKDDVDDFKKAAQDVTDPDLRNWAQKTLPVLEKHLATIQGIKNTMKK